MNATKIEYLDFTWSPLVGCSGTNCAVAAKCWAKYQAKRRKHKCQNCYEFKPHTHFERLTQPLRVYTPKKIGVCFSADMWDNGFTEYARQTVLLTAKCAPQHWFINLTKQPQNIPENAWFPDNWVQGVSVCTKKDLWRIETLEKTQAKIKMVSFEPLYEYLGIVDLSGISWIIIGNQTHPLKEAKPIWIDSLILDAKNVVDKKIPVFVKNNVKDFDYKEFPSIFSQG